MYIIRRKSNGYTLRFGSYSKATEVDEPYKASLFSRKSDADKRAKSRHWINGKEVSSSDFQVYEISFKYSMKAVK